MLARIATHPSVQISAGAAVVLAAASTIRPVPWPLWVAWAGLSALAVRQAVRR